VTFGESRATIDRYTNALAQGDYADAVTAAAACRKELARQYQGRTVAALGTLSAHIRRESRRKQLSYAKARWSREDEQVLRRYAQSFVAGRYPSARQAAALCQREIEQRDGANLRRGVLRRTYYGYYAKLLELARSMGLPCRQRAWEPAERRVLERYVRRLLAGKYKYTRDIAAACARELAEIDACATRRAKGSRQRPARSEKAVYSELTRIVASAKLPRYKAPWTRPELDVLERYARATARGKYRHWNEAAKAAMEDLRGLYDGKGAGIRPARLAGHRPSDAEQQIRGLAHRLNLDGPHMRYWTPPEERIFGKWVKLYHEGHHQRREGPLSEFAEGLRRELRGAGFNRRPSACMARLVEGHRETYGASGPTPRRWTAEEDKVADSWARWYDRHRRTHRLEPYKTATEGLQEDLAKIHSERSLCACRLRLLNRHRHLRGLK